MNSFKNILILFLSTLVSNVYGQDRTFSQFFLNPTDINPGITGIESYLDISLGYKQLWRDFDSGDNSAFLSIDKSFGQVPSSVYKNNSLRVSDTKRYDRIDQNQKLKRKHGLGISVRADETGALKTFNAGVRYAYHLPLTLKWRLSFGSSIKFEQNSIDFAKYNVRDDSDLFIQNLMANGGNQNRYLVDFGASAYSDNLLVAISANSLVNQEFDSEDLLALDAEKTYHAFVNHKTPISSSIDLSYGVLGVYTSLSEFYWAANARLKYKNRLTLGAGYDSNDRLSGFLGLRVQDNVYLNYSYDYFVGALSTFNVVNHELVLNLKLANPYNFKELLW